MISMIVAYDENRLIGSNNQLPWHFKDDLKYFKEVTMGHDILMGRLTFESILDYRKKPLPGRHHFVATKNKSYHFPEVTTVRDVKTFLENYPKDKELFIIGGAKIYESFLSLTDKLYVTHVLGTYNGDTWFPKIQTEDWTKKVIKDTENLRFAVYERKKI